MLKLKDVFFKVTVIFSSISIDRPLLLAYTAPQFVLKYDRMEYILFYGLAYHFYKYSPSP